jgi:hypothetical protein
MNLKARFSIIAIGFITFVIIAPILVLYARGFKYDFETGNLVKTGTLVMRTEPSNVSLYLNDGAKEYEAPASIRFLLPGDYNIRLEKDGYHTWQKRLTVASQFVTWGSVDHDKVYLLYSSPRLHSTWQHNGSAISADNSEIVFQHENDEYKISTSAGELMTLGQASSIVLPLPPESAEISWTNASQIWQLLQTTSSWPLKEKLSQITKIHSNGDHTAVLVGSKLYAFEISTMPLVDENVTGLTVSGDDLWYVSGSELKHYSFSSGIKDTLIDTLPLGATSQVIRGGDQIYVVIDQNLYHVKDGLERMYGPVTFAKWERNGERLLYGNANEIYLHNPITNNSALVIRSLTPITQAQLNWTTGYVFYANENRLMAAELDTRSGQNQFKIMDISASETFTVSEDGFKLYVNSADSIKMYQIR